MNLTPLVKEILLENEIKVEDLSQEFELTESGYTFLKSKIDKLNKKATKWGVKPMELKVNRIEDRVVRRPGIFGQENAFIKKYYHVTLIGDPPKVEGFTFIGKVQHTPGGENILNIAPGSPVKNLPEEYRTARGACDVCHQNRERFNTFVLRVDKDDLERFPDKKVGDLVQVGSGCLKRFLPGVSVDTLISYAQMIEAIRNYRGSGGEDDDDDWEQYDRNSPNPFKGHINTDTLLKYLCLVYTVRGKYIPKSQAGYESTPTSEEALNVMFDKDGKTHVRKQLEKNKVFVDQAVALAHKVDKWMKEQNFSDLGKSKPELQNYFGNLDVVAKSPSINMKNVGYLGGILQSYLHWERRQSQVQTAGKKSYVGKIGERIQFNGLVKSQKSFPSQFHGGVVTLYKFEDLDGNNIQWWANTKLNIQDGQRYPMSGIVKKQEVDKWSQQPVTTIKNARLEKD